MIDVETSLKRPDSKPWGWSIEGHFDQLKRMHTDTITSMLAGKVASKTVILSKRIDVVFEAPKTWFDHLLLDYPLLAKLMPWRKIQMAAHHRVEHASKTETVKLAALLPQVEIPEFVRDKQGDKFQVRYSWLKGSLTDG